MDHAQSVNSKRELKLIRRAIRRGASRTVDDYIDDFGVSLKHYGFMMLRVAIMCGMFEIARFFLDKGASVNTPKVCKRIRSKRIVDSPLHYAILHRHVELVDILLSRGSDVGYRGKSGDTALHTAVSYNRLEVARKLLEYNSDVDAVNYSGETPMILAIYNQNCEMIDLLAKYNPDLSIRNFKGMTPLIIAVDRNSVETVRHLLEIGADVDTADLSGRTPISTACRFGFEKICRVLIDAGCDFNKADKDGKTPLHYVCEHNSSDKTCYFVSGSIHLPYEQYERLLDQLLAARYIISGDIFSLLLSYGADINRTSDDGKKPLSSVVDQFSINNPIHQNAIKWKSLGVVDISEEHINSLHPDTLSVFRDYEQQCKLELGRIKRYSENLYALLSKSRRDIEYLASNIDLMQFITTKKCLEKFPLYCSIMKLRRKHARASLALLQDSRDFSRWLENFALVLNEYTPTSVITT